MGPGFRREDLRPRYDVATIREDQWHSQTGRKTTEFVSRWLSSSQPNGGRLLNAGAGIYELGLPAWEEFALDLFTTPLGDRTLATCASVEALPFKDASFRAVVCVGEVLAYCDPARAIAEFGRVLENGGSLIVDFGSSRSPRHLFKGTFGRAADLIRDEYNGSPEQTWVYDPTYIKSILNGIGFDVISEQAIHIWSSILRRVGVGPNLASAIGQKLDGFSLPSEWGDLLTIAAVRRQSA